MSKIIDKIIKFKPLKGFGVLVNNLTITPPRLVKLEENGFYPTDLYIFRVKGWFGIQNFWFFEKLSVKPDVKMSFRSKEYPTY